MRDHDPYRDPSRHLSAEHRVEHCLVRKATAVRQLQELVKKGFDVFINLCDGAWDEDRAGIEVVDALERLGQAFTGAGSASYDPSRECMKRVCNYGGLKTPRYQVLTSVTQVGQLAQGLRFPLIVKHPNSYSSVGLTRESRVEALGELARQVEKMISQFGGALLEEFIEGREFTVLVAENPDARTAPVSYTPIEFLFPPGDTFKHYELKWLDFAKGGWQAVTDDDLARRLREVACSLFVGIGGDGYGRCDIRMDAKGELYLLEINPNCAVFYPPDEPGSADMILSHDPAGHAGFLEHILRCGRLRQERAQKKWHVEFTSDENYGLYAAQEIHPGEVIELYEERRHTLVTRSHVEKTWSAPLKRWFAQYAYPITDEVFVMWDDRPEEWKPLNHSCDPNAWLEGLNLVARRQIEKGEAITVDYATFCGPSMEAFDCQCGSTQCRKVIRGTDCLEPSIIARYGDHVSDYVRRKQRRR